MSQERIRERSKGNECTCSRCGGEVRSLPVQRFGETAPVVVLILGSFLTFYLVGLVMLGIGAWLWTRRRIAPVCVVCSLRQDRPMPRRRARATAA